MRAQGYDLTYSGLRGVGQVLRIVAFAHYVVGALIAIFGWSLFASPLALPVAILFGFVVSVAGLFCHASGDACHALADIAENIYLR